MATSQNGWPLIPGYGSPLIEKLVVDGVSFAPGVRKGDVHTVLQYTVEQVAKRTGEKPKSGQCWGFDPRVIRGQEGQPGAEYSNHYSGTAVDFNSLEHPQGTHASKNWSAAQINAIHGLLKELGGVVEWGADYSSDWDPMHFEVGQGVSAARVAALARKIRAGDASPSHSQPAAPSSGGKYEPYRHGVKPGSRVIGQNTDGPWSAGDDVKDFQSTWNAWYPRERQLVDDGLFGPATTAAARYFQGRAHLAVDGFVGPKTWKAIGY